MEQNKTYVLSQDGKELFRHTDINECYYKLLNIQPMSTHWAMRWEGYKIESEQEFRKNIN